MKTGKTFQVVFLPSRGWVPFSLPPQFDGLRFLSRDECKAWFAKRQKRLVHEVTWSENGNQLIGRLVRKTGMEQR